MYHFHQKIETTSSIYKNIVGWCLLKWAAFSPELWKRNKNNLTFDQQLLIYLFSSGSIINNIINTRPMPAFGSVIHNRPKTMKTKYLKLLWQTRIGVYHDQFTLIIIITIHHQNHHHDHHKNCVLTSTHSVTALLKTP